MTKIFGILNITPDSFSDGGKYNQLDSAMNHIQKMIDDGADVIDIGAESTRPNAKILSPDEELHRLEAIVQEIAKNKPKNIEFSIDTRNHQTAQKAVDLGFGYINDVSGLSGKKMVDIVVKSGCKAIFMHSLTMPADKNITIDKDLNIVEYLTSWATEKLAKFSKKGVSEDQLIFDPGIGFGKTTKHNLDIIKHADQLKKNIGVPILIGHSRKSFLQFFSDNPAEKRLSETIAVTSYLSNKEVDYIRVHDVKENKLALDINNHFNQN